MNSTVSGDRNRTGRGGWLFLLEAARDPHTTGAFAPSGRALARSLSEPLRTLHSRPLTVMEVGAGTGSVTRALIPELTAGSRLDIVEANPRFADRLRSLVRTHPSSAERADRVRVHNAFVEEMDTTDSYALIVSSLPFTNFLPAQVDTIMNRYLSLLRPGGTLSYFSYCGTRRVRWMLSTPAEVRRHRAVEDVLANYQRRYATHRRTVWGNLPPAQVWQLQRPADLATEGRQCLQSDVRR